MILQPWHIQLFGALRARQSAPQGEHLVTRFRSQKYGVLLAYLAFHRGRSHPREVLIELIWPDSPSPESGRHRLSLALSSLRAQFEPPGTPSGSLILADRLSVELNPDAFSTDVQQFENALRMAAGASSDEQTCVQHLTEAADLFGGQLLPGYYEDWILQEGERLRERYLEALQRVVPLLERRGDLPRAVEYARRAVTADRSREDAHTDLIQVLLASGQTDAALRQWREMERALEEEVGEEPSLASRQILRDIERRQGDDPQTPPKMSAARQGRATAAAAPPAAVVPGLRGTVTFLLTDIEGSTAQWERSGEAFRPALVRHHMLLREACRRHGGREVKEIGDGFLLAFTSVSDALASAIAAQKALAEEPWSEAVGALQVRMAVYTGDVQADHAAEGSSHGGSSPGGASGGGDYHDLVLHRASRILAAAHGGQILCSEGAVGLVRRDLEVGIAFTDLGLFRLRDLPEPERLFQVTWEGMARSSFPQPAAERAHQGSLPLQFTRFFGREDEITRIGELLQSGVRLLTLTGPGGTGKTRLALEAAGRLSEDVFAGAVWFVPLADVEEAGLLPASLRDALGLPAVSGQEPPLDEVVGTLSRQPSLLLLDNFEQLLKDDEAATTVQTLLHRVPTLSCLVTSRQLLGLPGEREFPVPPLPTPDGTVGGNPAGLGLYDSVRLFVDRAQAVKPDFQVTSQNAPAVAELVGRLEGIPLAVELAAARAQVLTPAQMLRQLDNRFEFLVSRKRGVTERQRTLRAAIDWSFRLLSPRLQRFFARLSVLRGVWTEAAAQAVTGEALALDLLAELRESSLVTTEEASGVSGLEIRFRLLESLREFAGERLTSFGEAEERATRDRHAAYFRSFARERISQVRGPGEAVALQEATEQAPNLRAALDALRAALEAHRTMGGTGEGDVLTLAEARAETALLLGTLFSRRGAAHEAVAPIDEGLAALEAVPAEERKGGAGTSLLATLRAELLRERAGLHLDMGETEAASDRATEALALYRALQDARGAARAENLLGIAAMDRRDFAGARGYLQGALSYALAAGDGVEAAVEAAIAYNNLGLIERRDEAGDKDEAQRHLEEALRLRREHQDRRGIAETLTNLGVLAQMCDDPAQARSRYSEALQVEQAMGHGLGIARALSNLGEIAEVLGELEQAVRCFTAAEYLFEQVKSPYAAYAADLRASVVARLRSGSSEAGSGSNSETVPGLPGPDEGRSPDELIAWALQTPPTEPGHE